MLVNRYANRYIGLGWHQDNENVIDQPHSISSLPIGATKRLPIADHPEVGKMSELFTTALEENLLFVMKAGLQSTHYHRVHYGRNDPALRECGIRWSLIFRRLHSDITPSAPPQDNDFEFIDHVFPSAPAKNR